MIARLVLALSLLFLLPTSVLANELTPADNCVDQGSGIVICQIQSGEMIQAGNSNESDLTFAIESLSDSSGLGVSIRTGRLTLSRDFLSATIGCNTVSVPVAMTNAGAISLLASPASTAMFCPDLDTQETLLNSILLGRGLTFDLYSQTVRSENGVIELNRIDTAKEQEPIVSQPTRPGDSGIGFGVMMGAAVGDEMHHHAMHGRGYHNGFLASLATALIAFLLFGLGFFLGLQVDRRGGLTSPARPTTPSTPEAATTPVVRLVGEKQRNVVTKGRNANAAKKEKTYRV